VQRERDVLFTESWAAQDEAGAIRLKTLAAF